MPVPKFQSLVVLGFEDIAAAGDAVPAVAEHGPLALEGLDHTLIDLARAEHVAKQGVLQELPKGSGWLMVRLGATAYPPGGPGTHEGWEDAAVPPQRLGDYLRDFRALLEEFGYGSASLYGHFGQGCVHTRIAFDLEDPEGTATYRRFVERAARLVASYGGSLSGEHGDGQSRAELLPIMFGEEVVRLFGRFKEIFDPRDRMNPGKVASPLEARDPYGTPGVYRLDENLDHLGYHPREPRTHFDYPADHGRFTHAAARCVGIGRCRVSSGGVRAVGRTRRPTRSSPTPPNMPRTPPGAGSARPTTPASTARCCCPRSAAPSPPTTRAAGARWTRISPRSPKTGTPTGSGTTTGRSGRPKARSCSADSSSRSPPTSRATCRPRCAGSSATACGPAGLLAEEYDVTQRQLRGNLPQAFVHALLLECATRLNE